MIGEESLLHAVHAQLKFVAAGRRADRVGAGLLLAFGVEGHAGNELPWGERKARQLVDDEVEVVALGNFGDALFACQSCSKQFSRHDVLVLGRDARTFGLISLMRPAAKRSKPGRRIPL